MLWWLPLKTWWNDVSWCFLKAAIPHLRRYFQGPVLGLCEDAWGRRHSIGAHRSVAVHPWTLWNLKPPINIHIYIYKLYVWNHYGGVKKKNPNHQATKTVYHWLTWGTPGHRTELLGSVWFHICRCISIHLWQLKGYCNRNRKFYKSKCHWQEPMFPSNINCIFQGLQKAFDIFDQKVLLNNWNIWNPRYIQWLF